MLCRLGQESCRFLKSENIINNEKTTTRLLFILGLILDRVKDKTKKFVDTFFFWVSERLKLKIDSLSTRVQNTIDNKILIRQKYLFK